MTRRLWPFAAAAAAGAVVVWAVDVVQARRAVRRHVSRPVAPPRVGLPGPFDLGGPR